VWKNEPTMDGLVLERFRSHPPPPVQPFRKWYL
jgi:hypothetical protein